MDVIQSITKNSISSVTIKFLETLVDNRRLEQLPKIADKFIEYNKILNKEENIRIVSSKELT